MLFAGGEPRRDRLCATRFQFGGARLGHAASRRSVAILDGSCNATGICARPATRWRSASRISAGAVAGARSRRSQPASQPASVLSISTSHSRAAPRPRRSRRRARASASRVGSRVVYRGIGRNAGLKARRGGAGPPRAAGAGLADRPGGRRRRQRPAPRWLPCGTIAATRPPTLPASSSSVDGPSGTTRRAAVARRRQQGRRHGTTGLRVRAVDQVRSARARRSAGRGGSGRAGPARRSP